MPKETTQLSTSKQVVEQRACTSNHFTGCQGKLTKSTNMVAKASFWTILHKWARGKDHNQDELFLPYCVGNTTENEFDEKLKLYNGWNVPDDAESPHDGQSQ